MFDSYDSETFWLVVTNIVIGGAVLAPLLLVVGSWIHELVKRVKEQAS